MDKKATVFEFTSYEFEPSQKRAVFRYVTHFEDGKRINWEETITLPKVPNVDAIPKGLLEKTLQSLHLILGISYYKFYCATEVKLPYQLSKLEADFWNIIYKKGLGEFFYKNNLDPKTRAPLFIGARPSTQIFLSAPVSLPHHNRSLVGIGGGKDSIVSAELLKQHGFDFSGFVVESGDSNQIVNDVIKLIGRGDLRIQRQLDPQVHQKHQYNGHIPVSAIYAFLGVFSAMLYEYSNVIVSNEHSSNFGNTNYKGLEINHQWSKSFEFEQLFSEYVKNVLTPDIKYFSLLRPFHEIRIVELFSRLGKPYFKHFSSCNQNFKIQGKNHQGLWCGQCAKCIFVFTLLSAYLNKKQLSSIFGKNLYEDESLMPLFKDVLGLGTMKPFDCVGTFEESQTAMHLAKKNFGNGFIVRQIGGKTKLHKEVFQTTKENAVPEEFKFLGMKNVLIIGFGKEGKITKQYLKKFYPKFKIGIADQKQGSDYLKKQQDFDIATKTPGIKKEFVTIPYTTATNIFFSRIRQGFGGQSKNLIIGVTGSKGKSTTSSLIFHILKSAGKKVEFLGNIGKPMLECLLRQDSGVPKKNTIFVLELSSYQLDDLKNSPDISVVTNLYHEHVDYHGTKEKYHAAKQNIINFQNSNNHFVYNPEDRKQLSWLKNYRGQAKAFSKVKFKNNLIGEHNQKNIGAAVVVAEILQIPKEKIQKAVASFKALPHRIEVVGTFKDITFINDANAAIPEATTEAIQAIGNVDTIFLGGTDRGYNFTQLEKTIKKYNIKNVVLFPDSGKRINVKGLNILKTKSMKEAVKFAYKHTQKGSVCLLSCASPSYSLWKNFEQKGDEFKKFVKLASHEAPR